MNENEEDECPVLVPIDEFTDASKPNQRVPVTIVTGFLGTVNVVHVCQ